MKATLLVLALLPAPLASAQISLKPADAVIPVVGSTRGSANANFKTELQLANPGGTAMSGWLYLRPHGIAKHYDLAAHATLSFDDVVGDMGATGLGSLDLIVDKGVVPAIVARAFDDQPTGTTGVTVPAIPLAAILGRNETGLLVAPRQLGGRYRFNIGIRSMENGATLVLIVRDASGAERNRRQLTFDEHHFEQQPADAIAGIALQPSNSIEVQFTAGSAIVYATTVDNLTNDSSIQVLRK